MVLKKKPAELKRMRVAGKITAKVFEKIANYICPGITTAEIDQFAIASIKEYGAKSAFLGYRGYPGSVCISVNDEVVHGIPGNRRIQIGDIVSIDIGVVVDSFYGDMAKTIMIGVHDPKTISLVNTAEKALCAGIAKAVAGNHLSDVSHAIETCASQNGFSVVREFVGHGIGRKMHEEPQIPNFGPPGKGPELKEGMTLAIEPMLNMGAPEVEVLNDGWTAVTRDRKLSAHFEHTVVVGRSVAEILTVS
ncbi:type I methionyl aminopeptidase [Verrucomicrobiota bacterium]